MHCFPFSARLADLYIPYLERSIEILNIQSQNIRCVSNDFYQLYLDF